MNTDFSKQVKHALIDKDLSVNDLTRMVNEKYEKDYGADYISRVLSGYNSRPMRLRIAEVLGLEVSEDAQTP